MIRKLVAVAIMTTMFVTPVVEKDGDIHCNEQQVVWYKELSTNGQERFENQLTGEFVEKVPQGKTYTYEYQGEGTERTVSVILKNGVAMVEAKELADSMGINYADLGDSMEFFCYVTRKEHPSLNPSSVWISKKNNKYSAQTSEIKKVDNVNGSWTENVVKKGTLKTPIQTINGKVYVPAREVIHMINQKETKITYNESTKTVTFKQLREWYRLKSMEGLSWSSKIVTL